MKTIQSTVAFTDAQNNALANGSLILDLSQNAEVTSGGGQVVPKRVVITLDGTGKIPAATQIFANDELTPSGTTYTAAVYDSGGFKGYQLGSWSIAGASPIDLSTMTPVSSSTVVNPAVILQSPSGQQTINQPSGTNLSVNRFENIRFADQFPGADLGAKINAAAADAGTNGIVIVPPGLSSPSITTALSLPVGTKVYFPPGTFQIAGGQTISNDAVKIIGAGRDATIFKPTAATGDIFTITGGHFEISGITFSPTVTRTSGALFNIQSFIGMYTNLELLDMFDGFVQGSGASSNTFKDILVESVGGKWRNVFRNGPLNSGTIPGTTIDNFIVALSTGTPPVISGDLVVLDSGTDSTKINGLELSRITGSDTNVCFRMQSTGAAQSPSYVTMTNSYCETNNLAPAMQIDSAQVPAFNNLGIALGTVGLKITGGKGIKVCNSFFFSSQQGAIQITGGNDISILGNDISDCAVAGSNSFDAISVSAGVNRFRIVGNNIGNWLFSGNTFRNGISVASGASNNYTIDGNSITAVGTASVSDLGTGATKTVFVNGQVNLLNTQGPLAAVVGTGAQATLYTYTIPANTIPAGRGIKVDFAMQHTTGVASVNYNLVLGSTIISSWNDGGANTQLGYAHVNNASGVQNSQYHMSFSESGGTIVQNATGTAAENTANSLVLKLTMNVANTDQVTPKFWKVTLDQ